MRSALRLGIVAAGLSVAAMTGSAQVTREHGGPPPQQLGSVHFPTSCKAQAQPRFERAMALLHSFWWEESGVAFRQVAEADPGCVMAVWGQAMTLRSNPFAGEPPKAAQQAAWELLERSAGPTGGTPRERDYLNAVRAYFTDFATVPHATRALRYEQAMRAVAERYPEDTEATIFYALAVAANASTTDTSFSRQREVGQILEPLFEKQPDHPGLAHYIIHSYDSPRLASLGVAAARRYAEIAPAAYHAHHMPSHIFVRLGMWDETVASNINSAEASNPEGRGRRCSVGVAFRAYRIVATPGAMSLNRSKTDGSCPGTTSRGSEAIVRIRSCAARLALGSSVCAMGARSSRFS